MRLTRFGSRGSVDGKLDTALLDPSGAVAPNGAWEGALASVQPPRHFLFICGPFGTFTSRLAKRLRGLGARCTRVLLNGGDIHNWGLRHSRAYFGDRKGWADWLARVVERDDVTDVILYGDSHPYCIAAKQVAADHGIAVHVMEQGYFRPFWITLERNGVNAHSSLPKLPELYRGAADAASATPQWLPPLTPPAVFRIFFYHAAVLLSSPIFSRYKLPYRVPFLRQAGGHIARYIDQRLFRSRHRRRLEAFLGSPGPLFVVILQRPGDSQLLMHSKYQTTADFIDEVSASFAAHAPADARLVFRAHPLDHGLERHGQGIARTAAVLGIEERVFYADTGDLQDMLRLATGAVTVNSTAGLAALEAGVPTVVLGAAIYDMAGLTHHGGLDRFWTAPAPPDAALYDDFRRVVIARTQINGAYATRRGVDLAVPEVARRLLKASPIRNEDKLPCVSPRQGALDDLEVVGPAQARGGAGGQTFGDGVLDRRKPGWTIQRVDQARGTSQFAVNGNVRGDDRRAHGQSLGDRQVESFTEGGSQQGRRAPD